MSIAVLLTCHNRRAKTIACLGALFAAEIPAKVSLHAFVVDDGSSDGTSEAVRAEFPSVRLIEGDGSLFWNGGMRLAFAEAMGESFDYYLWLNDDTILFPSALQLLLEPAAALGSKAIVVGSTCGADGEAHTYGGLLRTSCWHPIRFRRLAPTEHPQQCDTMNGNCVLIPSEVARRVGNLSPKFRHGMGDFDYAFRAVDLGYSIWVARGYVGRCSRNSETGTWRDRGLTFRQRWKRLVSPKGLPPTDFAYYCRTHCGWLWPFFWAIPYVKAIALSIRFAVPSGGTGGPSQS